MELWIRSQNKGALIKVEMLGNTDGTIKSYLGNNQTVLGTYKSNERALEVLDEIQNILEHEWDYKDKFNMCRVYEMPKE